MIKNQQKLNYTSLIYVGFLSKKFSVAFGDKPLIKSDTAIAADLFKLTKSPYYRTSNLYNDSFAEKDESLFDIIQRLGIDKIFQIVFSSAAVNAIGVESKILLKNFWQYSYATACWTKTIAEAGNFYTAYKEKLCEAAILHDIGRLAYFKIDKKEYIEIVKQKNDRRCLFSDLDAERSALIGYWLSIYWNFPKYIRPICRYHSYTDFEKIKEGDFIHAAVICGSLLASIQFEKLNQNLQLKIVKIIAKRQNKKIKKIVAFFTENKTKVENEIKKIAN